MWLGTLMGGGSIRVTSERNETFDHPEAGELRPLFIAFEGVEGCGKSTQIGLLASHLERSNRTYVVTREPGGTPFGEALRDLLLSPASTSIDGFTELYLLEASRRVHLNEVINPALRRGLVVICDRFADSSVAYQGGGRELGLDLVEALNLQATSGVMPDITILLDLDPEIGLTRVGHRPRPEDRMEQEALQFHQRVRAAYLELAKRRGESYAVFDAQKSAPEIAAEIAAVLNRFLFPAG